MQYFNNYINTVSDVLKTLEVTNSNTDHIDSENGLIKWCEITESVKRNNKTMFFIGNGASASMASHMSADASKNGEFKARAFSDISLLTAVSNDLSYEEAFAMPLSRFAETGDSLVSISSSGNSPNIIKALKVAKEIGLNTITLSGLDSENKSRKMGDLNFYVPGKTYGVTEVSHQVILHCWLDRYMEFGKSND